MLRPVSHAVWITLSRLTTREPSQRGVKRAAVIALTEAMALRSMRGTGRCDRRRKAWCGPPTGEATGAAVG